MDYKELAKSVKLCGSFHGIPECMEECAYYSRDDMRKCIPKMTAEAAAAITDLLTRAEAAEASPSLLVSVECDENEEVESKWHEYLEYLIHWAISHSDKGFAGCMPACYNEWLDSEGSDEE